MMLQASLDKIAVKAYATFPGEFFKLRPDFIRTSEGMYSGRWLLGYMFFLHVYESLMKGDENKEVRKKDTVCEPASSPRNF